MRQFILRRGQSAAAACVLSVAFIAGAATSAHAQGIGFQGGFTVDPEQFYAGSHFETGELFPRFHFRPGIDGGFSDNLMLASINVEFVYRIPIGDGTWAFYQGGGPAILLQRLSLPAGRASGSARADTSVHAGAIVTFGFAHENGFFTEFKLGSGTSPGLRFGAGFTLRP